MKILKNLARVIFGVGLISSGAHASTYECANAAGGQLETVTMTPSADQTQIQLIRQGTHFLFDLDTTPESQEYRAYAGTSDDEPTFGFMTTAIPTTEPLPTEFECVLIFQKKVAPGNYISEGGNYGCKTKN